MVDDLSKIESEDVKDNFVLIFFDFLWVVFSEINSFLDRKEKPFDFWLKSLIGCHEGMGKVLETLCTADRKIEGLSERVFRVFLVVYDTCTSTWDDNLNSMNENDLKKIL